uniref:HOOK_N domain-containing protein n=1 Tax=Hymenolepis diminuta TaxID=6216 RepID=A0A0R3SUR0_HYMDI
LAHQQAECQALSAKHRHLENLVRELRRDNAELRDQINRAEAEDENSLTESDKHTRAQSLQVELTAKVEQIAVLEERLAKAEAANDALNTQLKSNQVRYYLFLYKYDDIVITWPKFQALQTSMAQDDADTRYTIFLFLQTSGQVNGDSRTEELVSQGLQLNATVIQQLTAELDGIEIINAESLLESVRNLRRLRNSLLSIGSRTSIKDDLVQDTSSPEYYSAQFSQLQTTSEVEGLCGQLAVCEKRRADLESRVAELSSDLSHAQAANRANEAALTASRRNEAALRRRLLATMDTGSKTSSRARPVSSLDYTGTSPPGMKDDLDAQTKVIKLEAANAALTEASQLDRARLQEQAARIAQLEAEQRTLHDRMASLQASESCAQRASVRLQALYEDMLREFSESTTQEANAVRRRQRQTDSRGYETDTALLSSSAHRQSNNEDSEVNKVMSPDAANVENLSELCISKTCVETREVLHSLQKRFIRTAEQLAEAETLLAEVAPTTPALLSHSSKSITCGNLLLALRAATTESTSGSSNLAAQQRLINRLERWICAQLAQREEVETQLRQRCIDMEVELAKSSSDIDPKFLKSCLEAQKRELSEVYSKFQHAQEELEATKALYESKFHCDVIMALTSISYCLVA